MQQRLKSTAGSTRTGIFAAEFLQKLLTTTDHALTALHMSFRREALSTFATDLESGRIRGIGF
jgi:hypothetical protein